MKYGKKWMPTTIETKIMDPGGELVERYRLRIWKNKLIFDIGFRNDHSTWIWRKDNAFVDFRYVEGGRTFKKGRDSAIDTEKELASCSEVPYAIRGAVYKFMYGGNE